MILKIPPPSSDFIVMKLNPFKDIYNFSDFPLNESDAPSPSWLEGGKAWGFFILSYLIYL